MTAAVVALAVAGAALAGAGWSVRRAVKLRARLVLVAEAAHELRGAATAITLAASAPAAAGRGRGTEPVALRSELARIRVALADLDAARAGRRAPSKPERLVLERVARAAVAVWRPAAAHAGRPVWLRWEGGPATVRADRGRLAQALGNLLANAVEHGRGPVVVRGRRSGRGVVVEVVDGGVARANPRPGGAGWSGETARRGLGLGIARRAVEQAGGTLTFRRARDDGGSVAAIELPLAWPDGDSGDAVAGPAARSGPIDPAVEPGGTAA